MTTEEYKKWLENLKKILEELGNSIDFPGPVSQQKKRPYSAPNGPGDVAICGAGDKTQIDVGDPPKMSLLSVPKGWSYPPELRAIAKSVNSIINKKGYRALSKKRKYYKDNTLTLTIAIDEKTGELFLSYAKPIESLLRKKRK